MQGIKLVKVGPSSRSVFVIPSMAYIGKALKISPKQNVLERKFTTPFSFHCHLHSLHAHSIVPEILKWHFRIITRLYNMHRHSYSYGHITRIWRMPTCD